MQIRCLITSAGWDIRALGENPEELSFFTASLSYPSSTRMAVDDSGGGREYPLAYYGTKMGIYITEGCLTCSSDVF